MRHRILAAVMVGGLVPCLWAAAPGHTGPSDVPLHLEGAVIQAAGDTVHFTDVPAGEDRADASGYKYYDVECKLSMAADGTVKVASATATPSARVPQSTAHFVAGVYIRTDRNAQATLSGPAMAPGGREVWSFGALTWTTGPAEGNPELALLNAPNLAGLPPGYCFGHADTTVIAVQTMPRNIVILRLIPGKGQDQKPTWTIQSSETFVLKGD